MSKRIIHLTLALLLMGSTITLQAQEEATATSLYNQGMELIRAKKYAEAFPLMEQAIEKADTSLESDQKVIRLATRNGATTAYYLGNKQRKAKQLDDALITYDKGIAYNPAGYTNYIGRAQTLEAQGKKAEAVKAFIQAGEVSTKAKKEEKAKSMYDKAENIVALAWGDKKWDNAQEYAMAFLELKESPEVHFYLAHALNAKGDAAKAVEHADKAIELAGEGKKGKYYMVKAESLEKMGQKDAAVAAYNKVSGKHAERAKYKAKELSGGK